MQKNYDKQRKTIQRIKKGDIVIINGRNIRTKHRCRKSEDKMLGPFEVLSVGSNLRFCMLKIQDSWRIHPVYNIELLKRYRGTNPKKQAVEIEADGEDWTMESIIASGPSDYDR